MCFVQMHNSLFFYFPSECATCDVQPLPMRPNAHSAIGVCECARARPSASHLAIGKYYARRIQKTQNEFNSCSSLCDGEWRLLSFVAANAAVCWLCVNAI